jgi:multicomponent Na+:H+ antiporter subunit D
MAIGLEQWIQLIPLWLPFIGALIIGLVGTRTKERGKSALGGLATVFFFVALVFLVLLWYEVFNNGPITIWYWPQGALDATTGATFFYIDFLTVYLAVVFVFLGFFVSLYSIKYMEHDTRLSLFYALLLTLVGGMIGVVMAGDFFTLFILWEVMSISSYVLVAFRKDEAEPLEAGIKYLLLSAVGSTLILFTMSILYGITGTINLYAIGPALAALFTPLPAATSPLYGLVLFTMVGLIVGFGVKAAIAPLSTWLPDAHPAAPSGISAMLSGVVIMTGSYAILRLFLNFYGNALVTTSLSYIFTYYGMILSWFAIFTLIFGNLMALTQKDIKRLLAYSTIVNVGYIIFGYTITMMPLLYWTYGTEAPLAVEYALTGSLFHITSHMLAKGALFLISGIFIHQLHTRDLDQLRGAGRRMPITMFCFTIAALSLAGVPPLIGFYSKFYIIWGSIIAGTYISTIILVLMSAFSVVYYLRMIQVLVFSEPSSEAATAKDPHPLMLFVIVVLTLFIIGIGLFPTFFLDVVRLAAESALTWPVI